MHRFHLCPHTKAWRNKHYDRQWQNTAEEDSASLQIGVERSHVWQTGLTAIPWAHWKLEPVPDTDDNPNCYTGQAYGDGSLKGAGEYAMCGWAVVAKEGHSIAHYARGLLLVQLPVQRTIECRVMGFLACYALRGAAYCFPYGPPRHPRRCPP